ncbi:MAG: SDR family NAD(P)-dependent oxidoreductase [Phycisphaerales bacterium]
MPIELRGQPILISGASSGIGAATALACARSGMPVALLARRKDKLEAVAERCRSAGVDAVSLACDVTDAEACEAAVAEAERAFGALHAVYANAGYGEESSLLEMPDDALRSMFETNFFGSVHVLRPALRAMVERGRGHALICSSCLGVFPTPYYAAYSATKAAQHHIGRALDVELRPKGVRVSTVHPVGTSTEFFDTMQRRGATRLMGSSEAFMQPASRVADAIVRCLRRPRPEVWTSVGARYGMLLAGAFPRTTNAVVGRMIRARLARRAGRSGS